MPGRSPVDLIDEALAHAERASSELDGVVRGILPTILVHGGLRPGVESLIGLTITSRPGAGTVLRAVLPVDPA